MLFRRLRPPSRRLWRSGVRAKAAHDSRYRIKCNNRESLTVASAAAASQPRGRSSRHAGRNGWGARIRTWEWRYQKPLPYHLATPQQDRRAGHGPRYVARLFTGCNGAAAASFHVHIPAIWRLHRRGGPAISRASVRSIAQPGRALSSGGRGRRFKSCYSDHFIPLLIWPACPRLRAAALCLRRACA